MGNKYSIICVDNVSYDPWQATGPTPSPETLAHGLANLCRYSGHVFRTLSVAEHSIWIALNLACNGTDNPEFKRTADLLGSGCIDIFLDDLPRTKATLALTGLCHDVSESWGLVDLPSPIGRHPEMKPYKDAHERASKRLCLAWGVPPPPWPKEVLDADHAILGAESAIRPRNTLNLPPWPNLDLAGKHDLSIFGYKYIRDAWIKLFYYLRDGVTK